MCVCSVAQLGPTLCDPTDCNPPGSSVLEIFQGRILEQVDISSSRGSSQPRDQICTSCDASIGGQILYQCATWEAPSSHEELWKAFLIVLHSRAWFPSLVFSPNGLCIYLPKHRVPFLTDMPPDIKIIDISVCFSHSLCLSNAYFPPSFPEWFELDYYSFSPLTGSAIFHSVTFFYVVNISFLLCLTVKLCPESNSLIVRTLTRRYEFLPGVGQLLGVPLFSQQYLYRTFCFSIVIVQSLSCVQLFRPHELQHARLSHPSPSPRICSNSWANEFELGMPSNHLIWDTFIVSPFAPFLVFSLANPAGGAWFCQGLS